MRGLHQNFLVKKLFRTMRGLAVYEYFHGSRIMIIFSSFIAEHLAVNLRNFVFRTIRGLLYSANFFCQKFFFALCEDSYMNISMAAKSWSSSVVSSWNILQSIYETFMERKRDGGDMKTELPNFEYLRVRFFFAWFRLCSVF